MTDQDPMAAIVKLRNLIADAGAQIGLHLEGFGIFPSNDPDDPYSYAQAVFHIDMDTAFGDAVTDEEDVDPEQEHFDVAFEALMGSQRQFEQAAAVQAAREDIVRTLKLDRPSDGIGLD